MNFDPKRADAPPATRKTPYSANLTPDASVTAEAPAYAPTSAAIPPDGASAAVAPADGKAARPKEIGGREGPDPTRYGDWELRGRCIDF